MTLPPIFYYVLEPFQKYCSRVELAAISPSPLIPPAGRGKPPLVVSLKTVGLQAACRFRQAGGRGTWLPLPAGEGGVRENARSLKNGHINS